MARIGSVILPVLTPTARPALTILLILALPVFGVADYATGPDFGFSLLYLLPVSLLAWRVDTRRAVAIAGLAAAFWVRADAAHRGFTAVGLWNGFTRLCMYVALAALIARVRADRDRMADLNVRLGELLEQEQRLARTDALTGVANSRSFREALTRGIARAGRDGTPLAVACVDLDNFKALNDTQGHAAGDRVLRAVAEGLTRVARSADVVARIGGDEFAVLLHDCDEAGAHLVAGRMLQELTIVMTAVGLGADKRLGASVGVACFREPPADPDAALGAADRALYDAKARGKGQMQVIAPPGGAVAEPAS